MSVRGSGCSQLCGERRREMKAGIARHESVEEQFVDVLGLGVGSDARVKTGGAAFDEKDDGVRIARPGAATRQP